MVSIQPAGMSGIQAKDAEIIVRIILYAMSTSLSRGDRIEIRDFGSFSLSYRPPRNGRNPKTGDQVKVPSKYMPHFRAGLELRKRVDYDMIHVHGQQKFVVWYVSLSL